MNVVTPEQAPGARPAPGHRAQLWFALRVLVCFGLVALALSLVDLDGVREHLASLSAKALTAAIGLHLIIIVLAAWRFDLLVGRFDVPMRFAEATRLTFGTTLANLCLPTSLAGDAGRVVLVRRHGLSWRAAVGVGVFDRMIGLVALSALAAFGAVAAGGLVPVWAIFACLGVSLAAVLGAAYFSHKALLTAALASKTFALSVTGHLISVLIAAVLLADFGVQIEMGVLAALVPAIILAASLPISVGGWGTRELAAVAAFGTIGMAPSIAVAMAFLLGVTQLAAAALGTGLTVILARRGAP
ncbi:MAG: lysylphosphatidylglycerol synthase transmembrane domain-containing protein [Pseudomonadota bacterium]